MIKRTLTISLLVFPLICFAQIDGFEFNRNNVLKFKKIISNQVYYQNKPDSSVTQTVYHINDLGDIVKTESFTDGKLIHFGIHEFDEQGQVISSQSHAEIYTYDEKVGDHTPKLKDGYYNGSDFLYKEGQLIEERQYNCVDGIRSYNHVYKHYYDLMGREIKTEHINLYIGLIGDFKPSSSILESMSNKDQIKVNFTTYQYRNDSIIKTILGENNEVGAYAYTIVNQNNLPELCKVTDSSGAVIRSLSYDYNHSFNLVERTTKIADGSENKYDMKAENKYIIKYREDGLPVSGFIYWHGRLISKSILTYE